MPLTTRGIKEKADEYIASLSGSVCAPDVAFITGLCDGSKTISSTGVESQGVNTWIVRLHLKKWYQLALKARHQRRERVGWASRTELYRCRECDRVTRFARFNNPSHLLSTRRGRCGEWANCFCLICRALSLDARYVLDFTDHVWVRYSYHQWPASCIVTHARSHLMPLYVMSKAGTRL